MAFGAVQRGVRSEQREPVIMLPDLLCLKFPALHRMTLLAIRSELPPMQIRVAIGAAGARFCEDEAGMALSAVDLHMHSAQRVGSAVVVEFRNTADRLPTCAGMAVLARNAYGTMRIAAGPVISLAVSDAWSDSGNTNEQEQESHGPLSYGTR